MVTPTVDNGVHNEVLAKLIATLRSGVIVPWIKNWTSGDPTRLPTNFRTGRYYNGALNKMTLWVAQQERQYPTGYWATAKQWAGGGAVIRPAEEPVRIVCPTFRKGGFVPAAYIPVEVFNLAQVDGVQVEVPIAPATYDPGKRTEFDELADTSGALIVHGGDSALYSYDLDAIFVPHPFRFPSYPAYAETVAHELLHYSESRLGVVESPQFLELRAEIGAAFLMAETGIPDSGNLGNHASYIHHWLDEMADDPLYLQQAAEMASQGVNFLLSFIRPADCQQGLCKITK